MPSLHIPSPTFDESLIQRSGSGGTDSSINSGLTTPRDEESQPFMSLAHAAKAMSMRMERRVSMRGSNEYHLLHGDGAPMTMSMTSSDLGNRRRKAMVTPGVPMSRQLSSASRSSIPQSPDCEDPEVTHRRARALYNMPNQHISIDIQDRSDDQLDYNEQRTGTGTGQQYLLKFYRNWNLDRIGKGLFKFLLFLPWCVAVGASIVLFPKKIDTITFHSGYLEPLFGIHRFAHWADRGFEHVVIFAGFLGLLIWYRPTVGITIACIMAAICFNAWYGFRLDPTIPLGADDQQSLYLTVTKFWLSDEYLNLRRSNNGYTLDEKQEYKA